MQPSISVITLAVDDLERALVFYRDGLGWPTAGIVGTQYEYGAVVFFDINPGLKLALWPRASLARDTGLSLAEPTSTNMLLSHNVAERDQVDAVFAQALAAGASQVKAPQTVFWGGYAGYFSDPDGHLWEVVFNPAWPS
ncbi:MULTISPECIES: VOC family protein [Idiomarinaceae]|uniref:VOC family protein n=1 Tax=Pseudidiomarina fusca TaxID=2965078 RepID=A0ABU3L058_9GAMM|nr:MULTISPECIES: VOC family protein [Idiomarinaceae]MDX1526203.1 VOC family protein [Pseudidiomarina maritima]MDT7526802.1 VOC family protein [Pseudidiomarina sp. GXY010]MRJ43179.1 VOC family protein [Idiomarina sp. FeN1]NCU58694.1 VOC family protein [Idiomarina sp. FenA--70]NCU61390.1 VOC family protein [Idiomarina sp. FenBw--71]